MAVTDFATSYAAIIKQEKQDDGTLLVYGKATDDALDIDNQICDAGWLNKAMPEWFKSGGNIREQHSNIAAGVAKELDTKADGHYISALVVDAQSVKKVEAGVLKGFSIGIRSPRIVRDNKAANGRIIDGTIVEVSLVDRPANPNAKLMLAKSQGTEVIQVEEMIEKEAETIETPVLEEVTLPEVAVEEVVPEVVPEVPAEVIEAEVIETPELIQDAIIEEVVEEKSVTASTLVALAKTINADVAKFDSAVFETARGALAQLIASEATDLANGEDEAYSLNSLMAAVNSLLAWRSGEDYESPAEESVEMAAEPEAEKSPVTTLPRFDVDGNEITDNGNEEEDSAKADKSALSDVTISDIIEKAVKSATDTVRDEIELLKSAKEADTEVINKLQAELATANSKAANGGPKRMATKPLVVGVSEYINKAAEYRAKAAATSDQILAKGWKEMAADFEAKAVELNTNN